MASSAPKNKSSSNPNAHRPSVDTLNSNLNSANPRTPSRSPAPGNANGIARSPSIRSGNMPISARAAARKPPTHRSHLSSSAIGTMSYDEDLDDERAETVVLVDDLKNQLRRAEVASEEYSKHLGVLQVKLDDALKEQGKLEDQAHEKDLKIETLHNHVRESTRQRKDLEQAYEADRMALLREKEQQASQEEELHFTIQRLKETIAQRDLRPNAEHEGKLSRSSSFRHRSSPDIDNGQFAPSAALNRSPSRNNSKIILQKDKIIESLRLELAEVQIRLVEMENMGDGRLQELERTLLETKMANARLMEDNESFQLLLSEKTLNGDFSKADFMQDGRSMDDRPAGLGSLADELESAGEGDESDNYRRLESEIKTLRDQNKALTLYIERIIGRLLQHEGFEAILDKADTPLTTFKAAANTEKELPPPPPPKDEPPPAQAAATPSFLQRARSVVAGQGNRPHLGARARPTSYMPPAPSTPTAHENPHTAPSIPLGRSSTAKGHQRSRSDQADGTAAAVVSQMYRGPISAGIRSTSGGPVSPSVGISPGLTTRSNTYFQLPAHSSAGSGTATSPAASRVASSSAEKRPSSSGNSGISEISGENGEKDRASPPRANNYTGAVMTQNKLRPLRLVQENKEMGSGDQGGGARGSDDEDAAALAAKKKANRGSWMGWMGNLTRVSTSNLEENQAPKNAGIGRDGSTERAVE